MIPLMRNTFLHEDETRRALAQFILDAPRLSMGEQCERFESSFAAYQNRRYAVLFNSGASANLALLQACKNLEYLKNGDEVGFSALTWATNVMPILQLGMRPVPVDCDRYTLNVMSHNVEDRLQESKLKALFITNALGMAGDLDRIKNICEERGVLFLEDNCESLGTDLPSGRTGNFGLGSTFSFFVAHHMSTIEGGMACTDSSDLAEMLRIVRANGWDRNLTPEQQQKWRTRYGIESDFHSKYAFYDLAYNVRPTEITGFLGSHQLNYLEANITRRGEIFDAVEASMRECEDLILMDRTHLSRYSSFGIPILCKSPALRSFYIERFMDAEVEIRPLIAGNIQRQPFYAKYVPRDYRLPDTEFLHECGFYCGNYPELRDEEIAIIKNCIWDGASKVSKRYPVKMTSPSDGADKS